MTVVAAAATNVRGKEQKKLFTVESFAKKNDSIMQKLNGLNVI